jgi:hypothetical protein
MIYLSQNYRPLHFVVVLLQVYTPLHIIEHTGADTVVGQLARLAILLISLVTSLTKAVFILLIEKEKLSVQ